MAGGHRRQKTHLENEIFLRRLQDRKIRQDYENKYNLSNYGVLTNCETVFHSSILLNLSFLFSLFIVGWASKLPRWKSD